LGEKGEAGESKEKSMARASSRSETRASRDKGKKNNCSDRGELIKAKSATTKEHNGFTRELLQRLLPFDGGKGELDDRRTPEDGRLLMKKLALDAGDLRMAFQVLRRGDFSLSKRGERTAVANFRRLKLQKGRAYHEAMLYKRGVRSGFFYPRGEEKKTRNQGRGKGEEEAVRCCVNQRPKIFGISQGRKQNLEKRGSPRW